MQVRDVAEAMQTIAPLERAESWDRVGLLIGSATWPAKRLLLTIDLTDAVLDEAIDAGVEMIVAYHPPIFEPLATLTDGGPHERIALHAARASIAVYSPHTALDATPGGVNDWLAGSLGAGDVRAIEATRTLPATEERKIVTFCPRDAVARIRNGLATAGAGRIGAYTLCSFEIEGVGTFHAGAGTSPTVGRRDRLERVEEVRLEMVCSRRALPLAIATLREFHPYEEPPVEIYVLEARPERGAGSGRRIVLDRKASLAEIAARIKTRLGLGRGMTTLRVAVGRGASSRYGTIGVCAGAGGALADAAIDHGCDLFLTGEMRHHDVLATQARGMTVVLAGHTNTERGYLKILKRTLTTMLPAARVTIARRDRDPLKPM